MQTVGWVLLLLNYMVNATGDHWQNYAGMLLGLMMIVGGHYLARR